MTCRGTIWLTLSGLTLLGACATNPNDETPAAAGTGSAAAAGTGSAAAAGTGSAAAAGTGSAAAAGSGTGAAAGSQARAGAGGAGSGETAGAGGDSGSALPSCPLDMAQPHNGFGSRFAWSLTLGPEGGGGAAGDPAITGGAAGSAVGGAAGAPGTAPSGCKGSGIMGYDFSGTCEGLALVAGDAAVPALVLDDGARLTWSTSSEPMVQPPSLSIGDRVRVRYESVYTPICPFCGASGRRSIEVRAAASDQLLFLGSDSSALEPEEFEHRFGIAAEEAPRCTTDWLSALSCDSERYEVRDLLLQTTPAQRLSHGEVTRVDAPDGAFEILWASAVTVDHERDENCLDGGINASDSAFAASWVGQ